MNVVFKLKGKRRCYIVAYLHKSWVRVIKYIAYHMLDEALVSNV